MQGGIISGGSHIIVPKRVIITALLAALGIFLGIFITERARFSHMQVKMKDTNRNVKLRNEEMRLQKEGYKTLFDELANQLQTWKGNHDLSVLSQRAEAETFQRSAATLLTGLNDMKELLQEKEIELLEKEHLLAIQQEQLLDTEDMTDEMAEFINIMATRVKELGLELPAGLQEEFFFGREDNLSMVDDDLMLEDEAQAKEDAAVAEANPAAPAAAGPAAAAAVPNAGAPLAQTAVEAQIQAAVAAALQAQGVQAAQAAQAAQAVEAQGQVQQEAAAAQAAQAVQAAQAAQAVQALQAAQAAQAGQVNQAAAAGQVA